MRPALHFVSNGWINDPYGIRWHGDHYEMFFQSLPSRREWAPEVLWGRAVGKDLVHWIDQGVALSPATDELGCWSGDVLQVEGTLMAAYTSVRHPNLDLASIRLAWRERGDRAPWVHRVRAIDAPSGVRIFRDPSFARSCDGYRLLVGAGLDDGTPAVLAYRSDDALSWHPAGTFARPGADTPPGIEFGSAWECPHVMEVDGQSVLLVSAWEGPMRGEVLAAVGSEVEGRLEALTWQRLTFGESHYAASPFFDRDGRPGLLMWLKRARSRDGSWTGAHSIPYRLSIADGRLSLSAHPDVAASHSPVEGDTAAILNVAPGAAVQLPPSFWGSTSLHIRTDGMELRGDRTDNVQTDGLTLAQLIIDGPIVELCAGTFVTGLTA